jgi:hypothetical protein
MPYCSGPGGSYPTPYLKWTFQWLRSPPLSHIYLWSSMTRQIKYLIAQTPGVIPNPLREVNFLMVDIPFPKPNTFMIRVNRQMKCPKSWGLRSFPFPNEVFFIAEYKTRPNDFDLQLVLVSCPKRQVKKNVKAEAMECSVLSVFRGECKVSDTGSAQCWASSCFVVLLSVFVERHVPASGLSIIDWIFVFL